MAVKDAAEQKKAVARQGGEKKNYAIVVLSFLVFVVACCHAAMAADDFRDGSLAKKAQEDLKLSETQEAMMQAVKIKDYSRVLKLAAAAKQQEEFDQVATEVMHERWGGMSAVRTDAFLSSLMMVMVSELGDKTFFIAAVMAMKHPRGVVLAGALGALALMTVLSAAAGFALPSVLPRVYTHYASVVLFLVFGVKLLKDAREMSDDGGASEELEEVEAELNMADKKKNPDIESESSIGRRDQRISISNTVIWQAFSLTFLAEWGDRSQIATIALAAQKDPVGVTSGGIIGHAICTSLAVVGGRMLASRISEKTVSLSGGFLFLIFAAHGLWQGGSALNNA